MPRKVIARLTKDKAVRRFLKGEDAADVARRLGVDPQSIRRWAREWCAENPEEYAKMQEDAKPTTTPEVTPAVQGTPSEGDAAAPDPAGGGLQRCARSGRRAA